MSEEKVKEDPIKLHKDANTLYEVAKYKEAIKKFLGAAELYKRSNNFFDAATMLYKAGECTYMLKDYETSVDHFLKSAEISFQKGFDRFGVSALEYTRDCYEALGKKEKVEEIQKEITEVKKKLETLF